jgi:membrane associated rhomboid family serine protease
MIPFKDNLRYLAQPSVTIAIIILNCLFFIVEEAMLQSGHHWAALVQNFGMFTPANFTHAFAEADPLAMFAVTCSMFTAMFLHGGLMHIFGNMVFLCCFGRAVEVRLGKKRFVAFYLLSGIAATFGQYLMNPLSETPNLGASGAIAGVLAAYMIFWPKAKILGLSLQMGVLYAPAWSYLLWWVGSQVVSVVFESPHAQGGVAYMAHIGGFVCGILAALIAVWLTPSAGVTYDQTVLRSRTHASPLGVVPWLKKGFQSAVSRVKPKRFVPQQGVR